MTQEKFRELLAEEVSSRLGAETEISYTKIRKNNGAMWDAMLIRKGDCRVATTIYPDACYAKYRKGIPVRELAEGILGEYARMLETVEAQKGFFRNYEEVRARIYLRLVSAGRNAEQLQKMPFRRWYDLALVCYYRMPTEYMERGTIQIQNMHLENWGVTAEQLLGDALQNTTRDLHPEIRNLQEVLFSLGAAEMEGLGPVKYMKELPLYVLSGEEQYLGAVCIALPGMAGKISEKLKGDFVMIPSSIHECLLLPDNGMRHADELNAMIREVNLTQLMPEDVLSDHIYHYHCASGRFDI